MGEGAGGASRRVGPHDGLLRRLTDHYDELLRHLRRRLRDPAAVEDVAQETFLRLHAHPGLPEVHSPRAFLFRVADNLAIDHLRRDRTRDRSRAVEVPDDLACQQPGPEAVAIGRSRLRRLEQAIAALPPRAREAFVLHKYDGLSYGEVAERLGISRSMVEKHVMRALRQCRDSLAAEDAP